MEPQLETIQKTEHVRQLALFTADTITLMGMSFVMGVLFTTLILLIFDFMRRNHTEQ